MSAWLFATLVLAAEPHGVLVDRVVAVVDKQAITESELFIEARVALVQQVGEAAAAGELDQEFLTTFLDYLIHQTLIAIQARRLGDAEVSEPEVEREVKRFSTGFRSIDAFRAFCRRFDITDETLRNILTRNLRNDRYIESRMRLRLLDSEARLGRNSARYREALARWLRELRSGVEIRLRGPDGELELEAPAHAEGGP